LSFFNPVIQAYYLSRAVCPSGFRLPLFRARRVHGPAAAFNVYKSRAPLRSTVFLFKFFSSHPSPSLPSPWLARTSRYAPSTLFCADPLRRPLLSASPQMRALTAGAGLGPEPSIYHSVFDARESLQR
jgi:hypothetical protein